MASGAVITGGTTQLPGMTELAEEILGIPVRRGVPKGVGGLAEVVRSPTFSTGVGGGYAPAGGGFAAIDGGVQIGYNFDQAGSFVWGLWATIPVVTTKSDLIVAGNNFPAELQWAAAMGVRAGLPIGDFLPFVLVGGVVGGGKASKVSAGLSDSQTHVGLGGEWAFSTRWSAILRYAFVDMSLQPYNIGGAGEKFGFPSPSVAISLNYHPGR